MAPQPAPQPQPGWGALYAAGAAHGLAVGRADRAEALGAAAALCARRSLDCRLVAEFTGRCGAVAQAVDREVLVALRPLGPASIMATAAGAGPTREQAQRAALENCSRQGSGICVLVAGACNER
ncbi:DUF4189 domain-containing protein [Siccirubricoccus sp. G192]|uniref:DUF4189 domain-containing protein n=1 Tax=Siccirubricoccus sp. G192 TaxID=2849651 RepID=UPI001C2C7884|nr:DUF4189 domain-containing protein [Siccirubricoccus sp. G192]MBV1800182.1 DUF4189 domain-containing protein [Siccirubricoccus sp. G192]